MATYKSMSALKAALTKATGDVVEEVAEKGYQKIQTELQGFYSQGRPTHYQRTGTLGERAKRDPVSISASGASSRIQIDDGYSYLSGSRNFPVVKNAEGNGAGILGRGGFWRRTMAEMDGYMQSALSKYFG